MFFVAAGRAEQLADCAITAQVETRVAPGAISNAQRTARLGQTASKEESHVVLSTMDLVRLPLFALAAEQIPATHESQQVGCACFLMLIFPLLRRGA